MTDRDLPAQKKPGVIKSLVGAMASWRTASVSLLGFSSGLPLGIVWIALPDWMRSSGMDIRVVGLITLAQIPWSFKFLWSPLMDRLLRSVHFPWRRGLRAGPAQSCELSMSTRFAAIRTGPAEWSRTFLYISTALSKSGTSGRT